MKLAARGAAIPNPLWATWGRADWQSVRAITIVNTLESKRIFQKSAMRSPSIQSMKKSLAPVKRGFPLNMDLSWLPELCISIFFNRD